MFRYEMSCNDSISLMFKYKRSPFNEYYIGRINTKLTGKWVCIASDVLFEDVVFARQGFNEHPCMRDSRL